MTPTQITLPLFTCICGDISCAIPYGCCHCGCGGKTTISKINRYDRGVFKDKPALYLRGHGATTECLTEERYNVEDQGYSSPCWIWKGHLDKNGYGRISYRKCSSKLAHIAMYEQSIGLVPEGRELDHLCRVRSCINPNHLEPVSNAVNVQRGINTKLNMEKAISIRELRGKYTYKQIAKMFGVTDSAINEVMNYHSWRENV